MSTLGVSDGVGVAEDAGDRASVPDRMICQESPTCGYHGSRDVGVGSVEAVETGSSEESSPSLFRPIVRPRPRPRARPRMMRPKRPPRRSFLRRECGCLGAGLVIFGWRFCYLSEGIVVVGRCKLLP